MGRPGTVGHDKELEGRAGVYVRIVLVLRRQSAARGDKPEGRSVSRRRRGCRRGRGRSGRGCGRRSSVTVTAAGGEVAAANLRHHKNA